MKILAFQLIQLFSKNKYEGFGVTNMLYKCMFAHAFSYFNSAFLQVSVKNISKWVVFKYNLLLQYLLLSFYGMYVLT